MHTGLKFAACSGLAIACSWLYSLPAIAEPTGLSGSYIGVTLDTTESMDENLRSLVKTGNSALWVVERVLGASSGSASTSPERTASDTQIQGRLDLPNSPVSLRGTVIVGNQIEAVMPVLSYDFAIGPTTNLYAGAGYVVVEPGQQTPLGDRDGMVLTTGMETAVNHRVIIYGDVRVRPQVEQNSNPMSVHIGIGHRF